jgi:integrase
MPKRVAPLSDLKVSKAKPQAKQYRLTDGDGLYLLVTQAGSKLWRFDYRFLGVRKTLAIGSYPEWSLTEARQKREESRKLVASGVDPMVTKKIQTAVGNIENNSFEVIAREWHAKFIHTWVQKHGFNKLQRLQSNIFPWIGKTNIAAVTAPDLLAALRRIEVRGAVDLAHRVRTTCVQIFQYGIATGRCERNIAGDLKGALPPAPGGHHAAPTDPKDLAVMLQAIEGYNGNFMVKCALQLAPMLFVRPGELRHMEWLELDGDSWSIPAGKMKAKTAHLVPLPHQAVSILNELRPLTGHSKYVFPCLRSPLRPMSDNTVNSALRRMGFTKDEVTGHGFRATARTILDEVLNVRPDFIEHQLAHAVRDPNGRAYNRTAHLDERKKMMQMWADYLDGLKTGK